jgi:hypothetical protein
MVPPQTIFFIGRPTAETLGPVPGQDTGVDEELIASPSGMATRVNEQMLAEPGQAVGRLESRTDTALFSDETVRRGAGAKLPSTSPDPLDAPDARPPRPTRPATSTLPEIEPRIIRDEAYRGRRLLELMQRAATNEAHDEDARAIPRDADREAD